MTKKIAMSLPDKTLAMARGAVKHGKARNVSNYIASLIDQQSATESFDEMIADMLKNSGASKAEIRAAERRVFKAFVGAGLQSP